MMRKGIEGRTVRPSTPDTAVLKRLLLGILGGGFEPSVAQPPLPLQEFLPLQPLSLDLHPPLPLQEF